MKYALDAKIICSNQAVVDTIKSLVPDKLDNKVWAGQYKLVETVDEETLIKALELTVRFNDDVDKATVMNVLKNKAQETGIKDKLESGSWLGYHLCGHDEKKDCGKIIKVWEK